jgi:predicted DNA-binding transcriptional regulator AlpA
MAILQAVRGAPRATVVELSRLGDHLVIPGQLVDYLGLPVATLYAWRYTGDGPPGFRVGRHLRYRWRDIEAWISGQLEVQPQQISALQARSALRARRPR